MHSTASLDSTCNASSLREADRVIQVLYEAARSPICTALQTVGRCVNILHIARMPILVIDKFMKASRWSRQQQKTGRSTLVDGSDASEHTYTVAAGSCPTSLSHVSKKPRDRHDRRPGTFTSSDARKNRRKLDFVIASLSFSTSILTVNRRVLFFLSLLPHHTKAIKQSCPLPINQNALTQAAQMSLT